VLVAPEQEKGGWNEETRHRGGHHAGGKPSYDCIGCMCVWSGLISGEAGEFAFVVNGERSSDPAFMCCLATPSSHTAKARLPD
jgi:hypothetical protein